MACSHCLCGGAQNLDIEHKYIRNLLQHFTSIYQLTITGGEPSLVPKTIRYILKQLKRFNIKVNYFYIVTNGSQSSISQKFIDACAALYDYQKDDEQGHMLEMNDDRFHCDRDRAEVVAALSK